MNKMVMPKRSVFLTAECEMFGIRFECLDGQWWSTLGRIKDDELIDRLDFEALTEKHPELLHDIRREQVEVER